MELRPLLDQAVRELTGKAEAGSVSLSLTGVAPAVQGNPNLLYRAFYNLIENAVKYNRPGGTVRVTLKQEVASALVLVEDDGLGIGEEALPHIFESFYRADPSRSQNVPGSGLGLAVVKMILERHHGVIQVSSNINSGSTFSVELAASTEK